MLGRGMIIYRALPAFLRKDGKDMFFGKREKDKDVRISESQYKSLVGGMSKKERKDFGPEWLLVRSAEHRLARHARNRPL